MSATQSSASSRSLNNPEFREGVIALLAALAYGNLAGGSALVRDGMKAPTLAERVAVTQLAQDDFARMGELRARIRALGASPEQAMKPFVASIDQWHRRTDSRDWYEGLMKAYAGSAIALDFYAEVAQFVDEETRDLVKKVVESSTRSLFAKQLLTKAIAADEVLASRLALWGRRLVGEAISQAQQAAVDNEALTKVLVDDGSGVGMDLLALGEMFNRLTSAHQQRMSALGLNA